MSDKKEYIIRQQPPLAGHMPRMSITMPGATPHNKISGSVRDAIGWVEIMGHPEAKWVSFDTQECYRTHTSERQMMNRTMTTLDRASATALRDFLNRILGDAA